MPSHRDRIDLRKLVLAISFAALIQAFSQPVRAEVRVSGQVDALIVETREAPIEEILTALRASFNLQYRTSGALNRVITGTYTGSLQRVVARLLGGYNYVMQSSAGGVELTVFGPGGAGINASASGRPFEAGRRPLVAPVPPRPSGEQGWNGAAPVRPPRPPAAPVAKSTTGATPRVSPPVASALTPPSASSVTAPANAAAAPTSAPPEPESVPQTRQPAVQGWDG
jgi:hypothetical protein